MVPAPRTAARFGSQTFSRRCTSYAWVMPFSITLTGSRSTATLSRPAGIPIR